jgi:hypothetical protein
VIVMSDENANEAASGEPESVKAPQRYWWVVLVVVPLAIAAMPLLRDCKGESANKGGVHAEGDQSPAIQSGGNVQINYNGKEPPGGVDDDKPPRVPTP